MKSHPIHFFDKSNGIIGAEVKLYPKLNKKSFPEESLLRLISLLLPEPTYMIRETAGIAAVQSLNENVAVQQINQKVYKKGLYLKLEW